MASQGWCAKQIEKSKNNRIKLHGNTRKGVLARAVPSTFAERQVAFDTYKKLMHGFREGNFVNHGGMRWVGRDGTGIPDEGYEGDKFYVAVVYPKDQPKPKAKSTSQGNTKVKSGGVMVAAAPSVAKWSRKSGFAGK